MYCCARAMYIKNVIGSHRFYNANNVFIGHYSNCSCFFIYFEPVNKQLATRSLRLDIIALKMYVTVFKKIQEMQNNIIVVII